MLNAPRGSSGCRSAPSARAEAASELASHPHLPARVLRSFPDLLLEMPPLDMQDRQLFAAYEPLLPWRHPIAHHKARHPQFHRPQKPELRFGVNWVQFFPAGMAVIHFAILFVGDARGRVEPSIDFSAPTLFTPAVIHIPRAHAHKSSIKSGGSVVGAVGEASAAARAGLAQQAPATRLRWLQVSGETIWMGRHRKSSWMTPGARVENRDLR
jgi:hypothetical protein